MTRGIRPTLTRALRGIAAAAAVAALVLGVNVATPSAAGAGDVWYTMTCKDYWQGKTNQVGDDYGYTQRYRHSQSTCSSHYGWLDVHYASSSGSGSTGKWQSDGQASVNVPEQLRLYRVGAYKSWHSGCGSGCHVEWSYA
ncbi:hypothetical protein [Glycomyces sp. NRRL B-16210]|uniref:hypothetical protein n=1 Tax=Glycomyces sp. NRRL B-16210 TaxID=1463821 RepID=UPI000B30501F|nr:hypothetical protein [Glycomyces sp. NRRL B-16210]